MVMNELSSSHNVEALNQTMRKSNDSVVSGTKFYWIENNFENLKISCFKNNLGLKSLTCMFSVTGKILLNYYIRYINIFSAFIKYTSAFRR